MKRDLIHGFNTATSSHVTLNKKVFIFEEITMYFSLWIYSHVVSALTECFINKSVCENDINKPLRWTPSSCLSTSIWAACVKLANMRPSKAIRAAERSTPDAFSVHSNPCNCSYWYSQWNELIFLTIELSIKSNVETCWSRLTWSKSALWWIVSSSLKHFTERTNNMQRCLLYKPVTLKTWFSKYAKISSLIISFWVLNLEIFAISKLLAQKKKKKTIERKRIVHLDLYVSLYE